MTQRTTVSNSNGVKMYQVDLKQGSDEWLKWRSKGITATDVPIILGISPYKTPWQLWAEKTGRINTPDISNNPNVKRGNRLEDTARQLAEMQTGELLLPVCGEFFDWDILRASFDGLSTDMKPYEFKAPGDNVWKELHDIGRNAKSYLLYAAQVEAQCLVSGSSTGELMFYKENEDPLTFDIELTEQRKQEILTAVKGFWEYVVLDTPPMQDPEKDWYIPPEGDDQFNWTVAAESWRLNYTRLKSLKDQMKVLETTLKDDQKKLISLMGDFKQSDVGGVKVSRFTKQGNIDYQAYLADKFPDKDLSSELENYRKASRKETRFTKSEDELVVADVADVISSVRPGYF